MRLSSQKIKQLCRQRGYQLKDLLEKAGVSRTAYYSLVRKESVLPHSIVRLAQTLEVKAGNFLEDENSKLFKINRLRKQLDRVLKKYPYSDPENIWHTLLLLEKRPIDRLRQGLLRGQKFAFHR